MLCLLSMYIWAVDAGSENKLFGKRVKRELSDSPRCITHMCFCFMHHWHHIVEAALCVLDNYEWWADDITVAELEAAKWPGTFDSAVKIITHTFRFSGNSLKMKKLALDAWGIQVVL